MTMRKLFFIVLSSLAFNLQLFAKPISINEAKAIANSHAKVIDNKSEQLLGESEQRLIATSQEIFSTSNNDIKSNEHPTFYVFSNKDNTGYVIVSADDIARPVLGYSNSGSFNISNLPENFKWWLSEYNREITWAIKQNITQSDETAKEWKQYKESNFGNEIQGEIVSPLIKSKWDQRSPYNNLCPFDYDSSKRALTGCVATAMAQIMNYWKYPEQGAGYHSYVPEKNKKYGTLSASFANTAYDWDNITNEYNQYSTATQNKAIATLMYHCGVALEMDYGVDVSGTYTNRIPNAMKTYFLYDSNLEYVWKDNYSHSDWIALLKNELDNNRPVEYSGDGGPGSKFGHSFVCDGYDSYNRFHFNFGWGGYCDGVYYLTSIIPEEPGSGGGDGNYSYRQAANIGIKPPQGMGAKIAVYDEFVMNQPSVWVNSTLKIKVNFQNVGVENFSGTIGLALYDSTGQYVMYIGEQEVGGLSPGYAFQNSIEFESEPLYGTKQGRYYVAALYKPSAATNWLFVKDDGNLRNLLQINIGSCYYNNSIITLYSEPEVNPSIVEQGADFYAAASFYNSGERTFYGTISAFIYDLNGQSVKEISYLSETNGLQPNYHYTNPLKFYGNIGDIPVGDYYVGFKAFETNGNSILVNSGEYTHLKRFTVVEAPVKPDAYEPNNYPGVASNITPTNLGLKATVTTTATIHESDVDHYKIVLPKGYVYGITSKMNDINNDSQYTLDAVYYVRTGNEAWSTAYDEQAQTEEIEIDNGGTVIFKVQPYNTGATGTYQLEIIIKRKGTTDVSEEISESFSVTHDGNILDIKSSLNTIPEDLKIYDISGAVVYNNSKPNNSNINISNLAAGTYFIEINSNNQIYLLNFVKQ